MSVEKRGKRWRARLRLTTGEVSKTFTTKTEAVAWEARMRTDGLLPSHTLHDLITEYMEKVTPSKRSARWEQIRLTRMLQDSLAARKLMSLSPNDVAEWRDRRLQDVKPGSVLREWASLQAVCTWGIREKRWLKENPFALARKPKAPAPRSRRVLPAEIDAIKYATGYGVMDTKMARVGAAFLFSLETGMRAGEICMLTWENISARVAWLPVTKNSLPRSVPLSPAAVEILKPFKKASGSVFDLEPAILDSLFRKAKKMAGLGNADLHFHDARAEALTRLSKLYSVMELAKISGHRDIRILQNTYYRETGADLAEKMWSGED